MKKYLLISHKFGNVKRGSYSSSTQICAEHPKVLESKKDIYCGDLQTLQKNYRRLIFVTQSLNNYSMSVNLVTLKGINHII